jgi:hypothetical protein
MPQQEETKDVKVSAKEIIPIRRKGESDVVWPDGTVVPIWVADDYGWQRSKHARSLTEHKARRALYLLANMDGQMFDRIMSMNETPFTYQRIPELPADA